MIIHHIKEENDTVIPLLYFTLLYFNVYLILLSGTGHLAYVTTVEATYFFDLSLIRNPIMWLKQVCLAVFSNIYFVVLSLQR